MISNVLVMMDVFVNYGDNIVFWKLFFFSKDGMFYEDVKFVNEQLYFEFKLFKWFKDRDYKFLNGYLDVVFLVIVDLVLLFLSIQQVVDFVFNWNGQRQVCNYLFLNVGKIRFQLMQLSCIDF